MRLGRERFNCALKCARDQSWRHKPTKNINKVMATSYAVLVSHSAYSMSISTIEKNFLHVFMLPLICINRQSLLEMHK